jgi:hypothetical protein
VALMDPLLNATKAKGRRALVKRVQAIGRRYGLTPRKMDQALGQFVQVLRQFNASGTFPITAVALKRNSEVIMRYQEQGIEFAIHGHRHVDHSQLSQAEQKGELNKAQQVFVEHGIRFSGFRCPYLRWNADTMTVLSQNGISYDSSQALYWDIDGDCKTGAYERVLGFYGARSATDYPALPWLEGKLVHIPYCIPDDEAIVDRLALSSPDEGTALWLGILERTHRLGELFTLGLHPERIELCQKPLTETLAAARELATAVWIARLDEIASWWRARSESRITVSVAGEGRLHLMVDGPPGTTILSQGLEVSAPTQPWAGGYEQVNACAFTLKAEKRPFIGVPSNSHARLAGFLRQQGFIVEITDDDQQHTIFLNQIDLAKQDERKLLDRLDSEQGALVRLGRWPHGARSALCVSGDVDALTLWDYGLRFLGN